MNQPVLGQQPNAQTQEDERRRQAQAGALSAMGTGAVRPVNPAQPGAQRVGTSAAARAQQTVGPAKGSGFTGVSRYMGANVGNRLGQTVTGRISGVGQQAQTQMGQAVGTFQTGVAQSQQKLQQAQTGFQQAYSGIMQGTSPYIQQQQPAAAAAPADGVGGISGAVNDYKMGAVEDYLQSLPGGYEIDAAPAPITNRCAGEFGAGRNTPSTPPAGTRRETEVC